MDEWLGSLAFLWWTTYFFPGDRGLIFAARVKSSFGLRPHFDFTRALSLEGELSINLRMYLIRIFFARVGQLLSYQGGQLLG